jgi:diguanylate cyclase (GGDEF)-like protein
MVLIKKIPELSATVIFVISFSTYIILGITMVLSIWFNRGRIFFISLFLLMYQLIITNYKLVGINETDFLKFNKPVLSILIPVNIIIFSQFKERGIFSFWGKLKILFIALEVFVLCRTSILKKEALVGFVNYIPFGSVFNKSSIIPMAAITYTIMLIFLITKVALRKTSHDKPIIGVLIFSFLSNMYIKDRLIFSIFLTAAGLILIIGIIEASYSMAYMDELTGIPARRALREMLMKLGNKYTLAMIDIDFFKKFNDTYGHDIGDEVLKLVATNLETVTGGGRAFRYGGEEFTIVFPGKAPNEVVPHLEKLREQVAKSAYTKKSNSKAKGRNSTTKQLFVTISIGVAEKNTKNKTTTEVMKAADKALYRAKKKGRNCVSK